MIEARVTALRKVLHGRPNYGPLRMALYKVAPTLMVCSDYLAGDLLGAYIDDAETIIVDRRLTMDVKRCVLVHELIHWARADDRCGIRDEHMVRRMTAEALIDEHAYRRAEAMYEGCSALIAEELSVTQEIVEDYKMLLSIRMCRPYRIQA